MWIKCSFQTMLKHRHTEEYLSGVRVCVCVDREREKEEVQLSFMKVLYLVLLPWEPAIQYIPFTTLICWARLEMRPLPYLSAQSLK